jgi:hypothetical protein
MDKWSVVHKWTHLQVIGGILESVGYVLTEQ